MSLSRWALSATCLLLITAEAYAAKASRKSGAKHPSLAEASITPPSAVGPRSPEEADLLWTEAKADFLASRYSEAARKLKRFIDRYPSEKNSMEAKLLLGRSNLRRGEASQAISPLLDFIESNSNLLAGHEARLDLGQAYVVARKFSEALLVSNEILDSKEFKSSFPQLEIPALLLRVNALLGLGREERAAQALDSARQLSSKESSSELEELQIRLQLKLCAKLPSSRKLEESQSLDQFGRRGDCILLTAPMIRRAHAGNRPLEQDGAVLETIRKQLVSAVTAFQEACLAPPSPLARRSQQQIKQYKAELSDRLLKIFSDRKIRLIELLQGSADEKRSSEREIALKTLIRGIEQVN